MTMPFSWRQPIVLLLWVVVLAAFFAQVEIQIEGPSGWAASLPTWRIEQHWLLDIFWGGRPLTGYHAWVFGFMAMVFHLPLFVLGQWTWRLQLRIIGCILLFWVIEDALWFVMNPAFGWSKLSPEHVPWHKSWFGSLPTDYWTFGSVGLALLGLSYLRQSRRS